MTDRAPAGRAWWVALFLAGLAAAPLAAAPRRDRPPKAESVAGTTWAGPDSHGAAYVYTFEPDGTLSYTSPSGTYRNGTWRQSGTKIYFETNGRYRESEGEITGKVMRGRAWNVTGLAWTWEATKKE